MFQAEFLAALNRDFDDRRRLDLDRDSLFLSGLEIAEDCFTRVRQIRCDAREPFSDGNRIRLGKFGEPFGILDRADVVGVGLAKAVRKEEDETGDQRDQEPGPGSA